MRKGRNSNNLTFDAISDVGHFEFEIRKLRTKVWSLERIGINYKLMQLRGYAPLEIIEVDARASTSSLLLTSCFHVRASIVSIFESHSPHNFHRF